jgi:hypothetical protein
MVRTTTSGVVRLEKRVVLLTKRVVLLTTPGEDGLQTVDELAQMPFLNGWIISCEQSDGWMASMLSAASYL